ncbi:MAG: AbrB/MazE/SpoVT family DNA-binding domain-containing protein [Candidatus Sungbacteria bacterium]|nr:AbrB/MazE/SpoVT family DNA-binding domain-containing protein [Candidatus Sungbacteria bacterium]
MTTKVQKWGNSLAVRIPKEMIRRLALREGSGIVVREHKDTIIIRRQERQDRFISKNDWRQYLIPISRKKENVSGAIDHILYGASR